MKQYVDLLSAILTQGEERHDRTGVGTKAIFGGQLKFDLRESLPLVTVKKTLWRSAFIEMLWFIRGEPHTKFLKERGVNIWDEWADSEGNLGPIYGVQWRRWPGKVHVVTYDDYHAAVDDKTHKLHKLINTGSFIGVSKPGYDEQYEKSFLIQERVDQLSQMIEMIKAAPTGRRHIVTAWNPGYIREMGLPPCHRDFQCYASNDGSLDLMMSIRSWDVGLGAPFNIAQYALLTHLLARATGRKARQLIVTYGDAHVYLNHVEPLTKLLETERPRDVKPQLHIMTDNVDIDGYTIDDFSVSDYTSGPFLKLPIAV